MSFESNINNCVGNSKNGNKNSQFSWLKHDHFTTQQNTFEVILKYIPKSLIIWMPFYADGKCGEILTELGYNVIHEKRDFFEWEPEEWDIVIDNPPYSCKKLVIDRLTSFNKPFALLLPLVTLKSVFMKPHLNEKFALIMMSSHQHHFKKLVDGVEIDREKKDSCNPLVPTWFCFNMKEYITSSFNYGY